MTKSTPINKVLGKQMVAVTATVNARWARKPWFPALILAIVTLAVYFPALHAGFVFDDDSLIIHNRLIHAGDGLHRFWFTTEAPDYWPLTSTLWWLEWRTWSDHALGYHVVSVLLHSVNAVLIWLILRRLKIPGAWLAGLVFAIHPVNVATVAWISEQKNILSMLFYAAAILLYLGFDENGRWRSYVLSLAAFLLALLSKTGVVTLPFVLLLCTWWLHGRLRRRDLPLMIPFFALSLASGLATIWFQYHRAMGLHTGRTESFAARLAAAGWIPWFYLYKALLPVNLTVIYPRWVIDASSWVSYLPGMILLGCLTLFWWKRGTWGRPWLLALGYFLVMLFPVLGFFDQSFHRYSLVADHWQYYSIIGVIALVVPVAERICHRINAQGRSIGIVVSAVIVTVLGVGTWRRSSVYGNEEALWSDNVAKNPNAWLAHSNLGDALSQAGRLAEGIGQYEQALQINPDYAEAHSNLGVALSREGKMQEAIQQYEQALRISPDLPGVHCNAGIALEQTGKIGEAIAHYRQALRIDPEYAEARYDLGNALLHAGKVSDAVEQYERALRIDPDYANAHNNLGKALLTSGRVPEAVEHFEQALRIKPGSAEVQNNLGAALVREGKYNDGVAHYEKALQLRPDYSDAHYNLAIALLTAGKSQEAAGHLERVLELNPGSAEAHYRLAEILEKTDRFQEATAHYEQALRIKPDYPQALNNLAWLLATRSPAESADPARAVELAERVCQQTNNRVAVYLDTLATAYAAAGRFPDAIATAEKAVELARAAAQPQLVAKIEARLDLYRAGHAYSRSAIVTTPQTR